MELKSYILGKNAGGGGGITPTGSINITTNGEHDVTNYATANVNVSGGTTPQSLDDVTTILKEYLKKVPNSYETLSTDNVTLYTPDAEYKNYFIQKRGGGYYRIVWIKDDMINCGAGQLYQGAVAVTNGTSLDNIKIIGSGSSSIDCYYGYELATVDACIEYAKNSNSTYTKIYNSLGYMVDTPNVLPVSNIVYFYSSNGTTMIGTSKKISSNETIEVKS